VSDAATPTTTAVAPATPVTGMVSPDTGPGPTGQGAAPTAPVQVETPEPVETAPLNLEDREVPAETAEPQGYEPTGDAGLDVALAFIGGLGFSAAHPAVKAAQQGDFTPMEAVLKRMGTRAAGYEPYLKVAKDYAERAAATQQAAGKETETAVVSAVGGAANWNAIQKWASQNADPAEKTQINAAFAAGPLVAATMAQRLAEAYKQSGQSTIKPEAAVQSGASGGVTAPNAISPAEFKAELVKLQAKHGWSVGNSPEYQHLLARRKAYQG
jgi:hypothetical protein